MTSKMSSLLQPRHQYKAVELLYQNWDFLLLTVVSIAYVLACPFTKVEESFNTHAIYDFLYRFPHFNQFDHVEFPGPLPRTFFGALIIAMLMAPLKMIKTISRFQMSIIVRSGIALLSSASIVFLLRGVKRAFGNTAWIFGTILTALQFHTMFYASRTLRNTFSNLLVNLAMGFFLRDEKIVTIILISIAAAVFRFELALILVLFTIMFSKGFRGLLHNCMIVLLTLSVCLLVTVPMDSFLWGYPVWSELCDFYFNAVLNKSHEWGTSPWHWYLTNALPGALSTILPLSFLGLIVNSKLRKLSMPFLTFVAVLSFLPHKELRFVFPIIPILIVNASVALEFVFKAKQRMFKIIAGLYFVSTIILQCLLCLVKLYASVHNYPAGYALLEAPKLIGDRNVKLHIDAHSAMSGCNLFTFTEDEWKYSKAENVSDYTLYTHLLTGTPNRHNRQFKTIASYLAFDGLECRMPKKLKLDWPCKFRLKPSVHLMAQRLSDSQ